VGFIITNYFAVSDLFVFWDVCKFDKETCVGSRNVSNTLKEASDFVAKPRFQSGCRLGSFKVHVFDFFSSDQVNDCIGLLLLGPMVISQVDGHVGSFYAEKVVLGQVPGRKIL
jgi:hypothetical protein